MTKIREVLENILENIKEHLSIYIFVVFLLISVAVIFLKKYSSNSLTPTPAGETLETTQSIKTGKTIVVDLSGAVVNPGVLTISEGSRVYEAIKKGGGVSNEASVVWVAKNINLSKKLSDSEKIYIPFDWELENDGDINLLPLDQTGDNIITVANSNSNGSSNVTNIPNNSKINVNKASAVELDTLSGIGVVYAQKIIDNRPYKDIAEFYTNSEIPKSTIDKIKDLIGF